MKSADCTTEPTMGAPLVDKSDRLEAELLRWLEEYQTKIKTSRNKRKKFRDTCELYPHTGVCEDLTR